MSVVFFPFTEIRIIAMKYDYLLILPPRILVTFLLSLSLGGSSFRQHLSIALVPTTCDDEKFLSCFGCSQHRRVSQDPSTV
jgi:hypothetical protein